MEIGSSILPAAEVTRTLNRSWPPGRSSTVIISIVAIVTLSLVSRSPDTNLASLGNAVFGSNRDGCCCDRHLWANEGLVQIRRLRSASSRARLRVPSVSAILRLAASSALIVSRADRILDDLATATITGGGTSGVFMVLMGLVLSREIAAGGIRHSLHMIGRGALNRDIGLCRSIRTLGQPLPAAWRPECSIRQRSFPPDAS